VLGSGRGGLCKFTKLPGYTHGPRPIARLRVNMITFTILLNIHVAPKFRCADGLVPSNAGLFDREIIFSLDELLTVPTLVAVGQTALG